MNLQSTLVTSKEDGDGSSSNENEFEISSDIDEFHSNSVPEVAESNCDFDSDIEDSENEEVDDVSSSYDSEEGISCVTEEEIQSVKQQDIDLIEYILAKKNDVKVPPEVITITDCVECLKFHGSELLGVATIKGDILLIKYGSGTPKKLKLLEHHMKACRSLDFSKDGRFVISISADKSIVISDIESCNLYWVMEEAHDNPLTSVSVLSDSTFITGDSDGCVKIWDFRTKKQIFSLTSTNEYIASIVSSHEYIAALGSDGTVIGFDARQPGKNVQSILNCESLTCGSLFRDESRLIIGTLDGNLIFYKWGEFDSPLEQYSPCRQTGINQVVAARSLVAAVGCEDGLIRAIHLYPNRPLGIIGLHSDGIESLAVSPDGSYLSSANFDNVIKLWNISYLDEIVRYRNIKSIFNVAFHLPSSQGSNSSDFFCDLE